MKEWVEDLTHEKLSTPEAQGVLDKFETADDAHIGYIELQKSAGRPFKLPESLEKLADDKMREEFTGHIEKLFGGKSLRAVKSVDDIKDVNFADGLADARTVNGDLVKSFSEFAVNEGYSKSQIQKLISFSNKFGQQLVNQRNQDAEKKINDDIADTKKVLEGLYGGEEEVKKGMELVRRLFQNHMGLTSEEYEHSPKSFLEKFARDPIISKGFINLAKGIVPEGETEQTEAASKKKTSSMAERQNKELPHITGTIWPKKK